MNTQQNTQLIDTKGAAKHMGLSESMLQKARITGEGPRFCRLGRAVRYRLCDLDHWAAERLVSSTSEAGGR